MISLCDGWFFSPVWTDNFLNGTESGTSVRLPHNVRELPLHYALPEMYEMVCGYRRTLTILPEFNGRRLFLQLDGAAHIAEVYVNGRKAGEHRCGYTAFRVEITQYVHTGDNNIAVKLDTTENPSVPPFGFVVDYLTYGGLYREVWLDVRGTSLTEDIFVRTPAAGTALIHTEVNGSCRTRRVSILDCGRVLGQWAGEADDCTINLPNTELWSPEHPKLYVCRTELLSEGTVIDCAEVCFGYRTVSVENDGVLINGKKLKLRGLNRHQCWPYMGYAAPESLQREDARILKNELSCNSVRTSHYPQSQYFVDECDKLGLLVFTELPGWQHIGNEKWKQQALENLREMVRQYRNHPSIFLWGVRINESQDDDGFYARANLAAHELDPDRQTSGVRYLRKSSLLEDVYAFNDFSHNGHTPGAKCKNDVTPDLSKPLLISEHNGHMFPTKSFDSWEKRQEHALRHARVLNAAGDAEHAGAFGWCMFDYQTHKDFGSGDRTCYHGVMDAFRNPKLAAAFYASQGDEHSVLEISSPMDIGDYPAGSIGSIYAFTNADEVRLYKNGAFVKSFAPQRGWEGLAHPPVFVDDLIGSLIETNENLPHAEAELLRKCLVAAREYGLENLPVKDKLRLVRCMAQYGLTMKDGVELYGKYVGNWGGEATVWRFEGIKNGEVVSVQEKSPGSRLHLEVRTEAVLEERVSYAAASVRVRILDEHNNTAVYAQLPVTFTVSGSAELYGPSVVTAEGGMCGAYVVTNGSSGSAELTVSVPGIEPVKHIYSVIKQGV